MVGICPPQSPVNETTRTGSWEEPMKQLIQKLLKDESGAALIEYVLIGGIISIVGVGAMITIGGDVGSIWTKIAGWTTSGDAAAPAP
jgi:pilus assembly protein Flp/PilA